jgi:RimJ/RimL family protein N-acetyltransferase
MLRALRGPDVPAITEACQDPDIQRWTRVPMPYRESDARGWIAAMRSRENAGEALEMAIADADSGLLIGAIGVVQLNWRHRWGEIGFWVTPEVRGAGVATTALRMLSRWVLGPLGLERAELRIWEGNAPARMAAEKAGFVHEGTLRGAVIDRMGGEHRRDVDVYGLLRIDVAAERAPERRAELGGGRVPAPAVRDRG